MLVKFGDKQGIYRYLCLSDAQSFYDLWICSWFMYSFVCKTQGFYQQPLRHLCKMKSKTKGVTIKLQK